jgi:hypothetical protein
MQNLDDKSPLPKDYLLPLPKSFSLPLPFGNEKVTPANAYLVFIN